jgi:RHS repeat-associated protein
LRPAGRSIVSSGANSYVYGPGDLPIEQINNTTGTVTYLHHDQAGSTRLLTGSTGTVTGKCTYGAYGAATCEGASTTPLGFDAQYTSTDTGLIYLRNRVYDPVTAQFLSRDPLDEGSSTLAHATGEQYVAAALRSASGSGPYVYANDNPLNNYDPTGLFTVGICVHGEVNFIIHIGPAAVCRAAAPVKWAALWRDRWAGPTALVRALRGDRRSRMPNISRNSRVPSPMRVVNSVLVQMLRSKRLVLLVSAAR